MLVLIISIGGTLQIFLQTRVENEDGVGHQVGPYESISWKH